jgi:hypothetical protein
MKDTNAVYIKEHKRYKNCSMEFGMYGAITLQQKHYAMKTYGEVEV